MPLKVRFPKSFFLAGLKIQPCFYMGSKAKSHKNANVLMLSYMPNFVCFWVRIRVSTY